MIEIAKKALAFLLPLASLCSLAHGQNIPAVTSPSSDQGFALPDVPGALHYGITGTEGFRTGYYKSGNAYTTAISGDAGYLSVSQVHPFSFTYSGGYIYNSSAQSSIFQNLALSQTLNTESWIFVATDSVSYLPESPSSGLSGIPGLGDVGVTQPSTNGQDVLSAYGQRIANTTTGSVDRKLTGSTDLQGSGTYFIQRFLSNTGGLDIDQDAATADLTHRLDALNNIGGGYTYARFTYPSIAQFAFTSQGFKFKYSRQWSRLLKTDFTVGPQINTTAPITVGTTVMPGSSSVNFAGSANATYDAERIGYSLAYTRGVRGGSGVIPGTISDSLVFLGDRKVGRYGHISASGGFTRNQTLHILTPVQTTIKTFIANVQASTAIAQYFTTYISYSAQKQDISGAATTFNGFSGLSQVVSVGLSYAPKPLHLGH